MAPKKDDDLIFIQIGSGPDSITIDGSLGMFDKMLRRLLFLRKHGTGISKEIAIQALEDYRQELERREAAKGEAK